jgi:hypothetical protein
MLIAALALILAPANSAVAVTTTASASTTAPTEAVDTGADATAEPTEERICRKRSVGGGGTSLVGANKMRTVCRTRAEWARNGAPAR